MLTVTVPTHACTCRRVKGKLEVCSGTWSSYKSTSAVADADSINTGSVLAFSGLAPGRIPDARAEAVVDLVGAGYDWLGQVGAMASSTFFHLSVSRTTRE